MGTERRLRAGLLRGQADARKSPPSQQGSRVIPPPHASSLGPASLGAPSPHTPWTPPPPRDQHFSAAPCGRGQRHSGGPHTPPGLRPPPLPKDQSVGGGSGRQAKPGRLVITPHAD